MENATLISSLITTRWQPGFLAEDSSLNFTVEESNLLEELGKGSIALEFFLQAIPCYIFIACFIKRHKEIKDLGLPRKTKFGALLNTKVALSVAIIIIRLL